MADLSLKITANFEEAVRQFKELAKESESAREKIEKFTEKFNSEQIDKFTASQKLAEAAITATKGSMAAMTSQQTAYAREIERLIKNGLSPESDAIKRLQGEYVSITSKIQAVTDAQKAQEAAAQSAAAGMKMIEQAAALTGRAFDAIRDTIQTTAEAGDYYTKTARQIGMSAETFQELEYAAGMSGVASNTLSTALQKLDKNIGDAKNGTGALTTELKNSNPALLEQLKNVKSNEEAFTLMMGAMENTPDEFSRAALAQAAFGESGQELIKVSEAGTAGIAEWRNEVRDLGLISDTTCAQSEQFLDAQTRLKQAFQGVGAELAEDLLPTLIDVIECFASFIAGISNWGIDLGNVAIAIAGVTVALTAYVAITKAAAAAEAARAAIKALTSPAGLAALAIGGLVAGIAAFVKHSNNMANAGEREAAAIKKTSDEAENLINTYRNVNGEKNLDAESSTKLLALYPGLANIIDVTTASYEELCAAIKQVREAEAADKAETWIKKHEDAAQKAQEAQEAYEKYREKALQNIENAKSIGDFKDVKDLEENIETYKYTWDEAVKKSENALFQINKIYGAVGKEWINGEAVDIPVTVTPTDGGTGNLGDSLQSRLSEIPFSDGDTAANKEMIDQLQAFLEKRADMEGKAGEERLAFFATQGAALAESGKLNAEELINLDRAVGEAQADYQKQLAAEKAKSDAEAEAQRIAANEAAENERQRKLEEREEELQNIATQARESLNASLADIDNKYRDTELKFDINYFSDKKAILEREQKAILDKYEEGSEEYLRAQQEFIDASEKLDKENADSVSAIRDSYGKTQKEKEKQERTDQIAALEEQRQFVLQNVAFTAEETIAIEKNLNAAIKALKKEEFDAGVEQFSVTLDTISSFADSILGFQQTLLDNKVTALEDSKNKEIEIAEQEITNSEELAARKEEIEEKFAEDKQKLIDEANEKAYATAVAQKVLSIAEATIQTYLAASKAFADMHGGIPGTIAAAFTVAAGLANVAKISATPIPKLSAETGGRFMVPDVSPRVDSAYLRVNPGETVDVTPRSMAGSNEGIFNINLLIDGSVLASVINKKARAGELYTLQLAGNL